MLVFFHVIIAGLECISMLPALSSCKVLVFVQFCKFLTAFIYEKYKKTSSYVVGVGNTKFGMMRYKGWMDGQNG